MNLVERHIIKENHNFYIECDQLCFKSKNLYNQSLYNVRQYYFDNKKYLNYNDNYHITKKQDSYNELPTKVSCQIIKLVDKNFKSFFSLIKNKSVKNNLPKYLDKIKGRFVVKYPKQSLSIKEFKKSGKIKLSKSNILINTKIESFNDIKEVRIIPKNKQYVIEIVYNKEEKETLNANIIASIDIGLNNLATIALNNKKSFIINGKPLKSINQYYNKKLSFLKSELKIKQNKNISNKIIKLTNKRINKINDYLHKSSRLLVNQLVLNNVSLLVIGKNINQKQDINMGKINNQNFVQIPIFKFLDIVKYKCELEGIKVIFQEESYTSKCSFIDNEYAKKYNKYLGKRIKRGLFLTKNNIKINADLNAAYNIMKKAIPNAIVDGIEVVGVQPIKLYV